MKKNNTVTRKLAVPKKNRGASTPLANLSLPTNVDPIKENIEDFSILLYGKKKIGKTSLAAEFAKKESVFFLMTEPGVKALSVMSRLATNWEEILGYTSLLHKDKTFRTVVIDVCDVAYDMCMSHVCKTRGIEHPQDEGYGKAWKALKNEFAKWMRNLLSLQKGVILISHDKITEQETFSGRKYSQVVPTLANQAEDVISGLVDMWFYYTYLDRERVLIIEGDDHISAGRRLQKNHLYTSDGRRLAMIEMGTSAEQAHANFVKAWNNKYTPPNEDYISASDRKVTKKAVVKKIKK